jgi:hypothetical protein
MSNVKFKYFGDTSKAYTNVITVASELSYNEKEKVYVVRFGFAYSNIEDKYNKNIGKSEALDRFGDDFYEVIFNEKPNYLMIDEKILKFILTEFKTPTWAKKLIRKYLKKDNTIKYTNIEKVAIKALYKLKNMDIKKLTEKILSNVDDPLSLTLTDIFKSS